MLFPIILTLLPAAFAAAIPATYPLPSCPTGDIHVPLIPGLVVPPWEKTNFISAARGVQNYTCTAGKYVAAGAVANFYDASCAATSLSPLLGSQNASFTLTSTVFRQFDFPSTADPALPVQFDHFFTPTTAGGIAPVFRNPRSGVEFVGALTTRLDAPNNSTANIPWLRLTAASGSLSKSVFRTHTVGGQPPSTCAVEGKKLSVDYSAMYYFTQ